MSEELQQRVRFPEQGRSHAELMNQMARLTEGDAAWRSGRVPLYVFGATPDVAELGRDAFLAFFSENALGSRRAFSSLKHMEEEVVAMGLDLFHAPDGAVGNMTSGGTESIVIAVKACRDWTRTRRGTPWHRGNIVLPVTAHPAFDKAARLMDLDTRRIPVRTDLRADPSAMAAAIDQATIMLVGSAPCFPYGVIDPLMELSSLAVTRDLWLHVDACVGGYLAPFVRDLGRPIPDFDFVLSGTASLSADLHKFGFCPKPASTVFFRDATKARAAAFDLDVWPSGRFTTATIIGTRPGGGVAAAWAVLNHLGREGYRTIARRLLDMRDAYIDGIRSIAGLRVYGEPDLTILSFGSDCISMAAVADAMASRGWVPGLIREPPGMHLMLSLLHEDARGAYLADLAHSVAAAPRAGPGQSALATYS